MSDLTDQQNAAATIGIRPDGLPPEFGGYNSMPPNWEETTESDFIWRFGQHTKEMHFRQVIMPTVAHGKTKADFQDKRNHKIAELIDRYCDVYFWTFPDFSGVGMIKHYNGVATRSDVDAFWIQWFKFHLCEHEFETTVSRMCYWEGVCKKCGYRSMVDSSG